MLISKPIGSFHETGRRETDDCCAGLRDQFEIKLLRGVVVYDKTTEKGQLKSIFTTQYIGSFVKNLRLYFAKRIYFPGSGGTSPGVLRTLSPASVESPRPPGTADWLRKTQQTEPQKLDRAPGGRTGVRLWRLPGQVESLSTAQKTGALADARLLSIKTADWSATSNCRANPPPPSRPCRPSADTTHRRRRHTPPAHRSPSAS